MPTLTKQPDHLAKRSLRTLCARLPAALRCLIRLLLQHGWHHGLRGIGVCGANFCPGCGPLVVAAHELVRKVHQAGGHLVAEVVEVGKLVLVARLLQAVERVLLVVPLQVLPGLDVLLFTRVRLCVVLFYCVLSCFFLGFLVLYFL